MTYATGSNSITYQAMLSITQSSDLIQNGVGTITVTPLGGVANLPALLDGTPGLPPVLTFAVTTLSAGSSATVTPVLTNPGAAGEASAYTITLGIPAGATGAAGTNATISGASDLSGSLVNGDTLYYNTGTSKWVVSTPIQTMGPYQTLSSSFASDYSGNASNYQVATVGLPSLPWAYYPMVTAQLQVAGTANTHIDLVARLGNATTGQQVGYGIGQTGAGPFAVSLVPNFGAAVSPGTYGQVAASTSATLYLVALQTNSTSDSWQTVNTNGSLTVWAVPV
jgi:hypothetical protein